MSGMTDGTFDAGATGGGDRDLVRAQSWSAPGPAELELTVDVGRIEVVLDADSEVRVEVRYEPGAGGGFAEGIGGLLSWLGSTGGADDPDGPEALGARAVAAAEISWHEGSRRLLVHSATELPLRMVPIAVTVHAPGSSVVGARTGAGDVTVGGGRAGRATVRTGSGRVRVAAVDGDTEVTTGSGDVDLGEVARTRVRTGSGTIRVASTSGTTDIKAGSGDVDLGEVGGDLGVRTGSGDVRVTDARAGHFELTTGSGGLRIGVHAGVAAELDLSSGSGHARSDLDVSATPPEAAPALHLRGRTGSGDVLVTRA